MTDGSVVLAVIRLLVSLAVVLVLLVALARWASKRGIGSARPGKASVEVEVLTRRSLGRNSTLQVVKVGTQVMVLGVTERGVNVLGELGEQDLVPAPSPLSVVPSSVTPGANSVLPSGLPSGLASMLPSALTSMLPSALTRTAPSVQATVPIATSLPSPAPSAAAPLDTTPAAQPDTTPAGQPAVMPALVRSTTWEEAEGRALIEAGLATRSSARAAREAAATRQARRHRTSRTIVPAAQSRSARRAAAAPTGWPWNAAAVVLGATARSRRG